MTLAAAYCGGERRRGSTAVVASAVRPPAKANSCDIETTFQVTDGNCSLEMHESGIDWIVTNQFDP